MNKFSVLLSVYSKEQPIFLEQSLTSILNQTLIPAEIVLVKDGPLTAELDYVIEKYQNEVPIIKVIQLPQNQGLGKALNEGLKYCSYELVARMDTDDIAKPDRFEKQIKFLGEHPEVDVCSSWIDEFIGDTSNVVSQRKLPEWHDKLMKYAKGRCPINHPTVMYKRSKVMEVGGYQGFPEDLYLWVKLIVNGAIFHNLQESLLYFRTSEDVYKRRGGWKYAKDDMKVQWAFYRMGFLSWENLIKNIIIRVIVRLMPNSLRTWVYKKLLRK